jgi:diaminohydroxyphosphoribosylaminopyrimidine deaminase/5-amino-6-(5-phosphoribosylamino)uracil reductase
MTTQNTIDKKWMSVALSLAKRTKGATWPNPNVGCVIVKDDNLIGRGWTAPTGRPHAETQALNSACAASANSTAYVTLEPCAHTGKTKPCTSSLIRANVARVVIATRDPDPRVSGQGLKLLKNAGISITEGILKDEACYEHFGFFNRILNGKPKITLKLATSLDGKIATKNNESKWITGERSRKLTHLYRMQSDAVMIGSRTAIMDDPSLNVRHITTKQQPAKIIIDTTLKTPLTSKIFQSANEFKTIICCGHNVDQSLVSIWINQGSKIIKCKTNMDGKIDLIDAMKHLGTIGINNIFCEGGASLATSLLKADLIDEFISMTSGLLIGANGRSVVGNFDNLSISKLPILKLRESYKYGQDVVSIWSKS